jgi:putative ABC transport system ATP-binding protein
MLQTQGIQHRYGSEVTLEYPDFTLEAGGQLVVTGPSGSGKTTLLHFVAGLLRPSAGVVTMDGTEITALGESARDLHRSRNIGYVFQDFHLMEGYSALENVLLGLGLASKQNKVRALEVLGLVGLGKRTGHTPRQLSTGERQRVALARAVAHRPKILLADEPTAHLDRKRAVEALELLKNTAVNIGASLMVVTHDELVMEVFPRRLEVGGSNLEPPARAPLTQAEVRA